MQLSNVWLCQRICSFEAAAIERPSPTLQDILVLPLIKIPPGRQVRLKCGRVFEADRSSRIFYFFLIHRLLLSRLDAPYFVFDLLLYVSRSLSLQSHTLLGSENTL